MVPVYTACCYEFLLCERWCWVELGIRVVQNRSKDCKEKRLAGSRCERDSLENSCMCSPDISGVALPARSEDSRDSPLSQSYRVGGRTAQGQSVSKWNFPATGTFPPAARREKAGAYV